MNTHTSACTQNAQARTHTHKHKITKHSLVKETMKNSKVKSRNCYFIFWYLLLGVLVTISTHTNHREVRNKTDSVPALRVCATKHADQTHTHWGGREPSGQKHLLLLQGPWSQFPEPTGQLMICNSSSRRTHSSSELHGNQTTTWCAYTHAAQIFIHIKENLQKLTTHIHTQEKP